MEYFDTWLWTLYLACWASPYWASFYCALIIIIPFFLVIAIILLHIYNPHVRWGWCMLHSSWQNWIWLQFDNLHSAPFIVQNWLYCTTNIYVTKQRNQPFCFLTLISIIYGYNVIDKTRFMEDSIAPIPNAEWMPVWFLICCIICCWQYNAILEYQFLRPQLPDLDPIVRPAKSYYLYTFHFFHWAFFYKNPMPWKFFNLMRLTGIYEFAYNDRSWQVRWRDMHVLTRLADHTRQAALAHASDDCMWPHLKPDLARETYQQHLQCGHIYDTNK
jgi:hypothetical protein